MNTDAFDNELYWDEEGARIFIELGRYFVPHRERQIEIICDLIPPSAAPFHILDLCCGEGLLVRALLERFPNSIVHGFDGSSVMLQQAHARVAPFGERFHSQRFDLADSSWRQLPFPVHAIVSSLAIHHLDGAQKQRLFQDMQQMLEPGGCFIIADIMQPVTPLGVALAGEAWDRAVQKRVQEQGANPEIFTTFREELWNIYRNPNPVDTPSSLFEQLNWLSEAGFTDIDVYWMEAGHAIFGGRKPVTSNQ